MSKKCIIAMSGGVDSSVAAFLMKENGYECIGATMKLYDNEDIGINREKTCCSLDDIEDARAVARRLSMPYYVFNFKDEFEEKVASVDKISDEERQKVIEAGNYLPSYMWNVNGWLCEKLGLTVERQTLT